MIKQVPATFTLDELLSYLREETAQVDGYLTAQEWADHFCVDLYKMRELLHQAKVAKLLLCRRATRERLDGCLTKVPVYAFSVSPEDAKEKPVSV